MGWRIKLKQCCEVPMDSQRTNERKNECKGKEMIHKLTALPLMLREIVKAKTVLQNFRKQKQRFLMSVNYL